MSFFGDLWKSISGAPDSVADDVESVGGTAVSAVGSVGSAISSTADFLSYIAWIFYPANLLRAVEFFTGIILMGVGITLLTKRHQGGVTGNVARRMISLSPAGRTIRTLEGRRMGRHEGQREAARMQARQKETYSARTSSANERERINRNARQA